MKIGMIAPIIERVPPERYGGTERVIHDLCEELVARGHDVTLFATGDSITSAKLVSVFPKALKKANIKDIYGANIWGMLNIGLGYKMQERFDIIHDHNWYMSLPTANIATTPVVMTLHGPLTLENIALFETLNNINFVTISEAQREIAPHLDYAGTVHNGLKMDHYPISEKDEGYLLFVGRISREKGVHIAIEAAKRLGLPLIIAAKIETQSKNDVLYYHKYIKPHLSDNIKWIGEVDEGVRNELMSKALCFLHPVTWKEPFGLTLIESMACGTPVVAFNLGSIPEIIVDGKTGYVVSSIDEMVKAVLKIKKINRRYCREYTLKNFSAKKMTDEYLKIYQEIFNMHKFKESKKRQIGNRADKFDEEKLFN